MYRSFLNILARIRDDGQPERFEVIRAFHPDWRKRITAPYWLFDESLSALDMRTPLHLATYDGRKYCGRIGGLEVWRDDDPPVARLHQMLLRGTPKKRGLRTTNAQHAHTGLPLLRGYPTDEDLIKLRTELLELMCTVRAYPRAGAGSRRAY